MAMNPVACAHFYKLVQDAVLEVFFGWSVGARKQQNKDCMFGQVSAWFVKIESSGRGGEHGHLCASSRALQVCMNYASTHNRPECARFELRWSGMFSLNVCDEEGGAIMTAVQIAVI